MVARKSPKFVVAVQIRTPRPNKGELAEWLLQQFAKLSFRNGRIGSNPILSANYCFDMT